MPSIPPPDCVASARAWERYWQSGALHSCATSFENNYQGAIAAFWCGVFSALSPGDRVLDLATGNGALPRLLLDVLPDVDVRCDAIDLSPVAPAWHAALPEAQRKRLHFHGRTPAEDLPFDRGSFDLVTSQYGIEYAELDRSVPELLRVLRRPGRMALVVHHAGSRPVTLAREEVQHLDWLVAPRGLLDTTGALIGPMHQASSAAGRAMLAGDRRAIESREHFNGLQRALDQRAATSPCPDVLHEARAAMGSVLDTSVRQGTAAATARLASIREQFDASRTRLMDLLRCPLDEADLNAFVQRFGAACITRTGTVYERGHLMGWRVEMDLPPGS